MIAEEGCKEVIPWHILYEEENMKNGYIDALTAYGVDNEERSPPKVTVTKLLFSPLCDETSRAP